MNEYKQEIIQTLLEELYPAGRQVEVNVYGGDFTCSMDIDTLLNATTTFDDLLRDELEVIFDEVQHQTIIGASSSDIREITLAMVIHFYENQFNIDVVYWHGDESMAKLVEDVFGYPRYWIP